MQGRHSRTPSAGAGDGRDPLAGFRPATRAWFGATFRAPTAAQAQGWPAIADGRHTLICAPTGSGKTLAAFLWCLDRLHGEPPPEDPQRRLRVLYVSPLKALVHDVERNLRAPLAGIALAAEQLGEPAREIRVAMRTGDTPADERRAFGKRPPDILVTTPESLYLILTSEARAALRGVEWVIVDEIHALASTKRGAHLALSLERLVELTPRPPQRIGLSATQRPLSAVAAFLGGREGPRAPRDEGPDEAAATRSRGPGEGREPSGGHAASVPDDGPDGSPMGSGAAAVAPEPDGESELPARAVTIVDAGVRKPLELEVVVPVEDMSRIGDAIPLDEAPGGPAAGPEERVSIWPAIHPRILELIRAHTSTIVFVNSRRLAERLAQRLNELAEEELVRAHHGSLAREQRVAVEDALKSGRLKAIVATSSLELGIDMGAVDLVIQVESPLSVSRGLQRIGRAGHAVDEPSRGVIFPKYRGDLLECAVVTRAMHRGEIEHTVVPRNPLDVLAQQLVAAAVHRTWATDDLYGLVRRAENFAGLGRDVFEATLAMVSGQYPSDEFAELRPRVIWDRTAGTVRSRRDARTIAVLSGGTIPDRGLFGVYLDEGLEGAGADAADGDGRRTLARSARRGGRRVGELDEEMVYEARPGDVFLLGASAWRVERITPDRVLVSPAPGQPGKIPFWKGDGVGRPVELGQAIGTFTRELDEALDRGPKARADAIRRLEADHDLDRLAAENVLAYVEEERAVSGALPTDRTLVVERFRDELGDWRVCVLTPFGSRVHAPWALATEARLRERFGIEVQPIWSDDGIVLRLPATDPGFPDLGGDGADWTESSPADAAGPRAVEEALLVDPEAIEDLVVDALGSSALFAARFRENAARALLLPRTRGMQRRPLWQMRQRSAQLLAVASRYGSFPVVLETYRECLQDVFDLPALRNILEAIRRRDIRIVSVETRRASPFAASLMFDYIAAYMYEGDAPLADRRAQALALDRDLLRELLGADELRELLDADALAALELELQVLDGRRPATSADAVHDLLRRLGDLSSDEVAARAAGDDATARARDAAAWLGELERSRRAVRVGIAGEERWIPAEDAGRYRDAVGVQPPAGLPEAFLSTAGTGPDPLRGLLARWARTHGPFLAAGPAARWRLPERTVEQALERMLEAGTLVRGEFRPGGVDREWCDPEVLRALRRRSLARLRREVEPVEPAAYARFLPGWQGVIAQDDDRAAAAGDAAWRRRRASPRAANGGGPEVEPSSGRLAVGIERLVEVVAQLEGMPLPASVLERDVLPARIRGYSPRLLDELGAAGEVAWVGHGSLGRDDGRIALYRPDRLPLLLEPATARAADAGGAAGALADVAAGDGSDAAGDDAAGWLGAVLLGHLGTRGASFYRDLVAAAFDAARVRGDRTPAQRDILDAIWGLVWAGLVTNDTFAPLRALRWRRPGGSGTGRGGTRLVPPEAAGRWSLVADAVRAAAAVGGSGGPPSETLRRHALAVALLDRQGVVTRDGVAGEGTAGGFGAVYPVLREMEERGRARRGYFVEGLGGAQFALPGAVDRLRAERRTPGTAPDRAGILVLAASDPAQPYGAALPWPRASAEDRRPLARAAGAYVVLVDGEPALYLERGGRSLQALPALGRPDAGVAAIMALGRLVADGRMRTIQLLHVDGEPVGASPWRPLLEEAGFRRAYRGWVLSGGPG